MRVKIVNIVIVGDVHVDCRGPSVNRCKKIDWVIEVRGRREHKTRGIRAEKSRSVRSSGDLEHSG